MNFYGHAHLAARIDRDPAYVLGSMLPDFEGMCGARTESVDDATVARGVELHHETDDVFHRSPEFVELCALGMEQMTASGVGRGAARACAHVGTELLLDGFVLAEFGPNAAYLEALDVASSDAIRRALRFPDRGLRFEALRGRLRAFGWPHGYSDADFVTARLVNALAARPRLSIDPAFVDEVRRWLVDARPRVARTAPALLARLDAALIVPRG